MIIHNLDLRVVTVFGNAHWPIGSPILGPTEHAHCPIRSHHWAPPNVSFGHLRGKSLSGDLPRSLIHNHTHTFSPTTCSTKCLSELSLSHGDGADGEALRKRGNPPRPYLSGPFRWLLEQEKLRGGFPGRVWWSAKEGACGFVEFVSREGTEMWSWGGGGWGSESSFRTCGEAGVWRAWESGEEETGCG